MTMTKDNTNISAKMKGKPMGRPRIIDEGQKHKIIQFRFYQIDRDRIAKIILTTSAEGNTSAIKAALIHAERLIDSKKPLPDSDPTWPTQKHPQGKAGKPKLPDNLKAQPVSVSLYQVDLDRIEKIIEAGFTPDRTKAVRVALKALAG